MVFLCVDMELSLKHSSSLDVSWCAPIVITSSFIDHLFSIRMIPTKICCCYEWNSQYFGSITISFVFHSLVCIKPPLQSVPCFTIGSNRKWVLRWSWPIVSGSQLRTGFPVEIGWDRLSRGDMPRSTVLWHHRVICPRARRSWQDGPARFEGCKTIDLFWKSRMIGNPMTETDHLDVVYIKNPFMVILDDWRDGL